MQAMADSKMLEEMEEQIDNTRDEIGSFTDGDAAVRVDMCVDMCVDMYVDMCAGMCAGMCVDMCAKTCV